MILWKKKGDADVVDSFEVLKDKVKQVEQKCNDLLIKLSLFSRQLKYLKQEIIELQKEIER